MGTTVVASDREWADVYVPDVPNERSALQAKALFFVPKAYALLCTTHGMNTTKLAATSTDNKKAGVVLAGRNAIGKVLSDKPVVYESALGFINVANLKLTAIGDPTRLTTRDIVACVFRLRDGPDLAQALNITVADLVKACGISAGVAEAALARYRITYVDAHAIWAYLWKLKSELKDSSKATEALTAQEEDLIKTEVRPNHTVRNGMDHMQGAPGMPDMSQLPPAQRAQIEAMMARGTTVRHCMTVADVNNDDPYWRNQECKTSNFHRSGQTVSVDLVCTGRMTGHGHVQYTYDSPEHYSGAQSMSMLVRGQTAIHTTNIDAHWVSADCGGVR